MLKKGHEDDDGQNGQNWLILDGFFCFGEIYFGCLSSPLHPPHPTLCACSEEIAFNGGENVIIADSSLGSLFDC